MMEGGCNAFSEGEKKTKDEKPKPAWLLATTPPRRARAGHSFVTTDDDDDFDFLTNSGFYIIGVGDGPGRER